MEPRQDILCDQEENFVCDRFYSFVGAPSTSHHLLSEASCRLCVETKFV